MPHTIGERLKKKRMDLRLFQKDIARLFGVSTDTVTYWEKGRVEPNKRNLRKIEEFLEIRRSE
jgi:transcriptional regulator with XRE-family HTH domain